MTKSLAWREALLMPGDLCEWFVGCFEPATAHRNHPIIGQVPVCPSHLIFGVDMTKGKPHSKDDDAEVTDLTKIKEDDKILNRASRKDKTGDAAGDALIEWVKDIDSE